MAISTAKMVRPWLLMTGSCRLSTAMIVEAKKNNRNSEDGLNSSQHPAKVLPTFKKWGVSPGVKNSPGYTVKRPSRAQRKAKVRRETSSLCRGGLIDWLITFYCKMYFWATVPYIGIVLTPRVFFATLNGVKLPFLIPQIFGSLTPAALFLGGVACPAFVQMPALAEESEKNMSIYHYQLAVDQNPQEPQAHYDLGIAQTAQGNIEEAIAAFRQALWVDREFFPAYNKLGWIYFKKGDTDAASEFFKGALISDPSNVDAYEGLAQVFTGQDQLQEAASAYWAAIDLRPGDAQLRYTLGRTLSKLEFPIDAIEQFEEVIRLKPKWAEVHNDLGLEFSKVGNSETALRHFRKAARLKPNYLDAEFNIGRELIFIGDYDKAVRHLLRAVNLQEDHADSHYMMGVAFEAMGMSLEGLERFRIAMRLKPDWVKPMIAAAWLQATSPDPQFRDHVRAITLAEQAALASPEPNASALDTLAAAYAASGDFSRAVEAAELALEFLQDKRAVPLRGKVEERLKLYQNNTPYIRSANF